MDIFETLKAGATEVAHEARNRALRMATICKCTSRFVAISVLVPALRLKSVGGVWVGSC
jgi:hypothetical protein